MPNQLQNDRFRTYDQQIDILKNQKGLIISDETITKESLINIGYFSLIGGYKYPFKNPMTRKYINTTFEDIYALYKFDRELRELTFKYLCEVEMKIRQVVSYCFCQHHGDSQTHYISAASYRSEPKYARDIAVLTNILSKIAIRDTDHSYLVHQRNAHQNVPLWVAVNALTFGQISKMHLILSILVDTFFSKISLTMLQDPKLHNTACVFAWVEDRHWRSISSGCSSN